MNVYAHKLLKPVKKKIKKGCLIYSHPHFFLYTDKKIDLSNKVLNF